MCAMTMVSVTEESLRDLRRVFQVVFPVSFNEKAFREQLRSRSGIMKLTYYNGVLAGALCCREEKFEGLRSMYIAFLGCLLQYRELGLGTMMLRDVVQFCESDGTFHQIFLHVQVDNEAAMRLYDKFGFSVHQRLNNYFLRLHPPDGNLLIKRLTARD